MSPMKSQLQVAKAVLRNSVRARLSQLQPVARIPQSRAACDRLGQQALWIAAETVLLFAPLADELNIWPLVEGALASGKTIGLPRFSPATQSYTAATIRNLQTDLHTGRLGIREPLAECADLPLNRLDLVLVPGVAFDLCGRRLGRGKGFYDRLLADVRGVKCGVAFDEQLVNEVPVGPQDVLLNCILTPTRWLQCESARGF